MTQSENVLLWEAKNKFELERLQSECDMVHIIEAHRFR